MCIVDVILTYGASVHVGNPNNNRTPLHVICLCATVLAAPQGYNYNQQQQQQNGFSVSLPNFNTNAQVSTTTKTQETHGFLQQAVNSGNLQQALLGGQTAHNTQQFSVVPKFPQYQPARQQNFGFAGVQQQQQAPLVGNFAGQHQQQFNGYQQQQQQYPTQDTVTKDIYVHVAPEDGEDQRYQQPALPPAPPRKHYRIVFIKAPSQNINKAALRIQQAPTEEKTIIYVLTKKPDPLDLQAAIQDVQPKQPSKPEVYFIKYKTQEEAQHAQRTIQAQYDQLGGTSQVSDEGIAPVASVIGSLDGSQQSALDFSNGSGHSSTSSHSSSSFNSGAAVNNGSKYLPPIVKL
ncbi:probable basic-leucine zipper transcription factor Q [Calliphora vicina]|uniref:probable basic-leucine zipper transcription factor Q n=1 Tax=Calliphora vicina TaxID=7373 RepID=UPI00325BC80F